MARGKTTGTTFARVAVDHQQALLRAEQTAAAVTAARAAAERNQTRTARSSSNSPSPQCARGTSRDQRTIRQLDVAQDTILTATQLIAFALRVYLTALAMTPETFVTRMFPVRGPKEIASTVERVVFYENPRDPEINAALKDACHRLNQRNLQRDGRRLAYAVEEEPERAPVRLI